MRLVLLLLCLPAYGVLSAQQRPSPIPTKKTNQFTRVPTIEQQKNIASSPHDITSDLLRLFTLNAGDKMQLPIPNGSLKGTVRTKTVKNEKVAVMNIDLSNYNGAWLSVLKIEDSGTTFIANVHHPQYADGLRLTSQNGKYFFVSDKQSNIITD